MFFILFLFMPLFAFAEDAPVRPVPYVDLGRYMGTWYEIARLTSSSEEKDCPRKIFTYVLEDDRKIRFKNECRRGDQIEASEGTARITDPAGDAKWQLSFIPIPGLDRVFGADYKIIVLADDYSYAVVSESGDNHLWILGRTPELSDSVYASILEKIALAAPKINLKNLVKIQ